MRVQLPGECRGGGFEGYSDFSITHFPVDLQKKVWSQCRSELLAKVAAWQRTFGVRKAVHVTLVTAAGLHSNENTDVVQAEVRLADLFA